MSEEKIIQNKNEQDCRRFNMAFSDRIYDFVHEQANKLFIDRSHFVNSIIRSTNLPKLHEYVESQPFRKGNHAPRKRGNPMKRMNIKFQNDVYSLITSEAKNHDTTITQMVNMTLELYAQSHENS